MNKHLAHIPKLISWIILPLVSAVSALLFMIPILAWKDVGWIGSILLACMAWPCTIVFCFAWFEIRQVDR